jgi:hypothetical protein
MPATTIKSSSLWLLRIDINMKPTGGGKSEGVKLKSIEVWMKGLMVNYKKD